jgi:hypothetical protein
MRSLLQTAELTSTLIRVGRPRRPSLSVIEAGTAARPSAASRSSGRIKLRVAGEYPVERVADAQRAMSAGGLRGRAVLVF